MPRRYRRKTYHKNKYSIEHSFISTPPISQWSTVEAQNETQSDSKQFALSIIPPTDLQGMRKVKHFTLTFGNFLDATERIHLLYALVFVPQGYTPQQIFYPAPGYAQSMYQANQFVISSGVLDSFLSLVLNRLNPLS